MIVVDNPKLNFFEHQLDVPKHLLSFIYKIPNFS